MGRREAPLAERERPVWTYLPTQHQQKLPSKMDLHAKSTKRHHHFLLVYVCEVRISPPQVNAPSGSLKNIEPKF